MIKITLFHQYVQAAGAVTAGVENRGDLGDITLPADAQVITRVWAHGMLAGAVTAVMGLQGYIQIESKDCDIAHCEFLLEPITAPLGTGETYGKAAEPRKYVVNCPAKGGTVLSVYHVCDSTITTTTSEIMVTIEYAKVSPFPGGQVHMRCGEPGVAGSVSDGGVVSLTDIEIPASILLAVVIYAAQTTIVTATGIMLGFEMKSTDFKDNGSHSWGINTQRGGVATNCSSSGIQTFLTRVDAPFKKPGSKQNVTSEVTSFDAVSTGPMCNWCLIYKE